MLFLLGLIRKYLNVWMRVVVILPNLQHNTQHHMMYGGVCLTFHEPYN